MLDRRAFLATLGGGLLAAPLVAEAQQAGKVSKIGYLTGNSAENDKGLRSAFQQGLTELGYIEGKNVLVGDEPPSSGCPFYQAAGSTRCASLIPSCCV